MLCLFCLQVSGDHQHPGWEDLCSGSSQPGHQAVGPGRGLRVPGGLQPQQAGGTFQQFSFQRTDLRTGGHAQGVNQTVTNETVAVKINFLSTTSAILQLLEEDGRLLRPDPSGRAWGFQLVRGLGTAGFI